MTPQKAAKGLDFEALRFGIERCDPDLLLSFYAEDARLSILNAEGQRSIPFELRGKPEIAKHLRAAFGQAASHRVERELIGEDRVTFREACDYPDGGSVVVETTLEVNDGKIVRQVDVVANGRSVPAFGNEPVGDTESRSSEVENRYLPDEVPSSEEALRDAPNDPRRLSD